MDYQAIIQLISGVGFPIVMCLFMMKYITDDLKNVVKALNDNALEMQKLVDKIEQMEETHNVERN